MVDTTDKADGKLDKKFIVVASKGRDGALVKVKDGTPVPDDEWVVFLAKDNAFAAMLPVYYQECVNRGCDQAQLKAAMRLLTDVRKWRADHPERCKDPDAEGEVMLG